MSPSILSLCLTYTSSIWPCAIFRIFCNYGIITTEISTSSNNNKNNSINESTIKSRTEEATSLSHCWNLCCLHLWKLNWEQKKNCTLLKAEQRLRKICQILYTKMMRLFVVQNMRDSGNIYNYYSYANTHILLDSHSRKWVKNLCWNHI